MKVASVNPKGLFHFRSKEMDPTSVLIPTIRPLSLSLLLSECACERVSIFNIRCRESPQLCNLYYSVSVINTLGQMGNLSRVSAASASFHGSLTQ